jgi:mercuric ion binding protein
MIIKIIYMKLVFISLLSISILASCASKEEKVFLRKEAHTVSNPTKEVKANSILTMKIDGMTCMMGCGASIRKELYATKAVKNVDFDFEEGRETNTAKIAFDNSKISEKKMVEIISKMNEKQFTVGEIKVEPMK